MSNRNSKILIAKNIKLDKSYKDVLNYTENQMLELLTSNDHLVGYNDKFSFIRDSGEIVTSFSYNDCLKCNYMAFQNPDYSNKWFFAFIDDVKYISESATKIYYTIDVFATWFDYWNPSSCLVLREHVNSDNIGEHTYPEGLEHGDYVLNAYDKLRYSLQPEDWVIIATSWLPSNTPNLPAFQMYGGIFSGVYYLGFREKTYAQNFLLAMAGFGRIENIVTVFMAPSILCNPNTYFEAQLNSKEALPNGNYQDKTYDIHAYFITNNVGVQMLSNYTININSTLNGYTPINKKLYCYPYNYLLISNNEGANAVFNYEDFINHTPIFDIFGCLCPGCSIKLYPKNYKLYNDNGVLLGSGFNEGLIGSKYPICSYLCDAYVNWLTQQSVNSSLQQVASVVQIGLMTQQETGGTDSQYMGLFQQQANYLSERYQRALVGNQAKGNINGGDVTFAADQKFFTYYKMSIRYEYARKLDEYFNRFGYQVNEVKLPNQIGRPYWNFVQIGPYENIGYSTNTNRSVPANSMEKINSIYRNGVTIWHDHDNLGNYNLNNYIQ